MLEFNDLRVKDFNEKVYLIVFGGQNCAGCEVMKPVTEELASEGYPVVYADVEKHPITVRMCAVRSLPTTMLFVKGDLRKRHVGTMSKKDLVRMFNDL